MLEYNKKNLNSKENLKLQWVCYKPAIFVVISLIVALILMRFGIGSWTQRKFIENAMSPEKLLVGYCRWGWLAVSSVLAATVLVMAFSIYAIVFIFTNKFSGVPWEIQVMAIEQTVMLAGVCMALVLLMDYAYFTYENPFGKIKIFEQECEEIRAGNYKMAEVYLHPEHYESDSLWGLPDDSNCRFTSYKAIGNGFVWDKIYVPDYITFEPDDTNPYNEWQSVKWNEENAARYKITYTPNLRIIIKIETLPPNGAIEQSSEFSDKISAKGSTKKISAKYAELEEIK